jgi:hypothetical protein
MTPWRKTPSSAYPAHAIRAGPGFLVPTAGRSLARYQLALDAHAEFRLLKRSAQRSASKARPRPIRILHVIVPEIRWSGPGRDGRQTSAVSRMEAAEVARCRTWFRRFCDLVFVYTGGAARVRSRTWLRRTPVTALDSLGERGYWLSPATAVAGGQAQIRPRAWDAIGVYYKFPDGIRAGLLGGALGGDAGVLGIPAWSQWIADWSDADPMFSSPSVASLHEWLHTVAWAGRAVMGYDMLPDCHAGEEHGYWDQDGAYHQWQAWNRDLMLRLLPRRFWERYDVHGRLRPARPANLRTDRLYRWARAERDWPNRLRRLTREDLAEAARMPGLEVEIGQRVPNSSVAVRVIPDREVESPCHTGALMEAPIRLDNVLLLDRASGPTRLEDPVGGYAASRLESLAWVRLPRATEWGRDLLLIRLDAASAVLPLLRVQGRSAANSLLGYLSLRDPSEGQAINVLVALVDFGDDPPRDELQAIGAGPG